ncbi:unnamed protein product [Polarella glacialis]|uniref:Protein farnesyltransferase subunit beta n=1 Tax=Polarella glacialis TaxID=89957 RepID=A0A813HYP6_POLGL|nr:unnamed protein product [Polarella glacialis]CAE8649907.1 unnamed protein product [Polarella glacialis]
MAPGGVILECPATITSLEQQKTENDVRNCFTTFLMNSNGQADILLNRELHTSWLKRGLRSLPTNFAGLDASRPWFVYWISHALEVLDDYDESIWASKVASFLSQCQHPTGGFAGGPRQLSHLAPTYAAVSALVIAGSEAAYKAVDRETMYRFLMSMKSPHGGFKMHHEGETDMRGSYCALAVASMLHILTDELADGIPEYIRRCQTWEGGLAGEEGLEAHGGYSYCGLAALCIIGKAHALDLHAFLNWAARKQMAHEGGFQGRANKLVDSCYNFWLGGIFPLLHEAFRQKGEDVALPENHSWFAPSPLQTYGLLACQHAGGGLKDKPGKSADFYHTCYALSGLSVSQHGVDGATCVVGDPSNLLQKTDIYYNVLIEKAERKSAFFEKLPPLVVDGRQICGQEGEGALAGRRRALDQADRRV